MADTRGTVLRLGTMGSAKCCDANADYDSYSKIDSTTMQAM
jgi:hypothetical protein